MLPQLGCAFLCAAYGQRALSTFVRTYERIMTLEIFVYVPDVRETAWNPTAQNCWTCTTAVVEHEYIHHFP